ncbi:unnamed protein product [Nippostrongylus brasiliensis]|uniref:Brain-specific homeobox protein homolog (inferred by orthology to a human protein) n=1 Tax=Nippostrongylus brasiliensis TaxID=27835 RepID=A0A0N4YYJ0_NIPBR|nr:unnamed protein product [Nippostrongylus brasiliensis]
MTFLRHLNIRCSRLLSLYKFITVYFLSCRRKARTVFSDQQLQGLEKRFETQRYLSTPERIELANALNLSETQENVRYSAMGF